MSEAVVSQVVTDEQTAPSVGEEEVKQRNEKLREALHQSWMEFQESAENFAGRISRGV